MAQQAHDDLRITDQFVFEEFWAKHGKNITVGAAIVAAVGLILLYWQHQTTQKAEEAANRLAMATDAGALERIVRDFPGSSTAADALLQLAHFYFSQGKFSEANAAYDAIQKNYPSHPLASSAKLGQAEILEAQGNITGAIDRYREIAGGSAIGSYVATAAKMDLARCLQVNGQSKEARQTYEEVLAGGQGSPWFSQAYIQWVVLSRDLPPEKVEQAAANPSATSLTLPPLQLPTSPTTK